MIHDLCRRLSRRPLRPCTEVMTRASGSLGRKSLNQNAFDFGVRPGGRHRRRGHERLDTVAACVSEAAPTDPHLQSMGWRDNHSIFGGETGPCGGETMIRMRNQAVLRLCAESDSSMGSDWRRRYDQICRQATGAALGFRSFDLRVTVFEPSCHYRASHQLRLQTRGGTPVYGRPAEPS